MKLIAETQEPCKASGHPVRVKWYLAEVDEIPEQAWEIVLKSIGSNDLARSTK